MHSHVGFKIFYGIGTQFVCTCMWFLSYYMVVEATFVRRHVGFKLFYASGTQLVYTGALVLSHFMIVELNFCAQAFGFDVVKAQSCAWACGL